MPVSISRLTSRDVPGAITAIQEAFKDDPYALFVYSNSSTKVRPQVITCSARLLYFILRLVKKLGVLLEL